MAPELDDEDRPRIKITDKRHIRDEDAATAPADQAGAAPASETLDQEGADVTRDIDAARSEAAEYLDHLRRLQAEFDNYRKRVLKEQTDAMERAAAPAIQRLLEVLDDFELALMSANDKPDFDRFLHGVELVYAKLAETLKAEGLERIDAQGRPFDPEQHEALMQTGEGDHLVVADVLRPGYTLRGRVIRPAGVRVNRE
ncbi:MAG: nucleotide exchange factor GrpE [Actinomycetota bacterium]